MSNGEFSPFSKISERNSIGEIRRIKNRLRCKLGAFGFRVKSQREHTQRSLLVLPISFFVKSKIWRFPTVIPEAYTSLCLQWLKTLLRIQKYRYTVKKTRF